MCMQHLPVLVTPVLLKLITTCCRFAFGVDDLVMYDFLVVRVLHVHLSTSMSSEKRANSRIKGPQYVPVHFLNSFSENKTGVVQDCDKYLLK